ncbi:hypothetical protein L218DRAFT_1060502 [Marasmius fiardii PR-910]|nr:hypothetical protein L218DRAFT_1060502 [Marasmius fiardii PR-910]
MDLEIYDGAISIRVGRSSAIIGYTVALYDWLISIDEEYDLIWTTPQWTAIKCTYILCRYFTLAVFPIYIWLFLGSHSEDLCQKLVHPLYGLMTLFHLFPQVVMIVRTWAFTGRNTYVLFFLIICLFAFVAADVWVFGTRLDSELRLSFLHITVFTGSIQSIQQCTFCMAILDVLELIFKLLLVLLLLNLV